MGGRIVAALLSLIIVVAAGYAWATYRQFNTTVERVDAIDKKTQPKKDVDGKARNILMVGIDDRDSITEKERREIGVPSDGGSLNTDTMMILHVPADGKKASVISFPRDSWVTIAEGFGQGKLNSAYADGVQKYGKSKGWQVLVETLQDLTGLTIDHFVAVNLYGFYTISKAIGGVSVCLNRSYTREETNAGLALPKGKFTVSGKSAIAFVRQRDYLPRGDLDRIVRQQYFLSAAFRKVESAGVLLNPFKLHDLLGAVGSSLLTDPKLDLLSLGRQFALMSDGDISYRTIPNNGPTLFYPDGVETSIVEINTAAIPAFVRQLDHKGNPAYDAAHAASPGSVTVDVLNGTDIVGLAGRNGDQLQQLGFKINTVDSTDTTATTTIEYPTGMEAQAKAVANAVHGAKVVPTSSVQRVTLVLGVNGVQVNGLARSSSGSAGSAGSGGSSASKTATTKPATNRSTTASTGSLGCIN
jgi:LCP family protein required for cell wall assembly